MPDECATFGELIQAATGRSPLQEEKRRFDNSSQEEKNRMVRDWVDTTQGRYTAHDEVGTDGKIYTAFDRSPEYLRRIGTLPSYLRGVALDLNIGDEASVDNTGHMHDSEGHGYHGDLYFMRRVSASTVEITKLYTDEL
jgi:hypothetical protein